MNTDYTQGSFNAENFEREYSEYYAIREPLDINVVLLSDNQTLPEEAEFKQHIPAVFRLASEIQGTDLNALTQLRSLGDAARIIGDVLHQQNAKLNALLGYLLRREDNAEEQKQAFEYGGAGVGFYANEPYQPGQLVELKLFMPSESAAIYSYAQIFSCTEKEPNRFAVKALFVRITAEDRELMVRASLHAQTRLLKKRASDRGNDT